MAPYYSLKSPYPRRRDQRQNAQSSPALLPLAIITMIRNPGWLVCEPVDPAVLTSRYVIISKTLQNPLAVIVPKVAGNCQAYKRKSGNHLDVVKTGLLCKKKMKAPLASAKCQHAGGRCAKATSERHACRSTCVCLMTVARDPVARAASGSRARGA